LQQLYNIICNFGVLEALGGKQGCQFCCEYARTCNCVTVLLYCRHNCQLTSPVRLGEAKGHQRELNSETTGGCGVAAESTLTSVRVSSKSEQMLHSAAQLHALPRHAHHRLATVVRGRTHARHRVTCAAHIVPAQSAAAQAAVPTTAPSWASFVSRRINIELALEEAIEGAKNGQSEGWEPELAVVFLSSAYVEEYASLISLLRSKVPSLKHVVGSTVSVIALIAIKP
jgi:hypothetical protein